MEVIKRVIISDNTVFVNNTVLFSSEKGQNAPSFFKEIYQYLKIDYPKFFKMDNLSKLGFLAAEILLLDIEKKEHLGIILASSSSSLDTDEAFVDTIKDANFFPSPSVFVYTLPNIVIGEICIRHKIHGENAMFILEKSHWNDFSLTLEPLIRQMKMGKCVIGYIDFYKNNYQADFFCLNCDFNLPPPPELCVIAVEFT